VCNASHHQACAREKHTRAFNTGFAHTTIVADHAWAISKFLGSDAWVGTLKPRLGLPDHILETLPKEEDIVGEAFGFEKQHPELFSGDLIGQLGVYFSYETRNHTMFGNLAQGYPEDYMQTLSLLFRNGICAHTVFTFPEDAKTYPLILLPSPLKMTEAEQVALSKYLEAGGKVLVSGPAALPDCKRTWTLPNRVSTEAGNLFITIVNGVSIQRPGWATDTKAEPATEPDAWTEVRPGLYYNPHRLQDAMNTEKYLTLCKEFARPLPLDVQAAEGYLVSVFDSGDRYTVQLLAEDYDVDIDHHLDSIRFHRSRVNFITKVLPAGVGTPISIATRQVPKVYTPFVDGQTKISVKDGICTLELPEDCSYAILDFPK
ncbi:MAG: hypothetical protein J6Q54_04815, partial [Oscillospiraceae bacterium]|nr:hypothetical protein [Oscillospiraceae bacterium]